MVGILTFHRATNYGTVLQAYGLQHTLNELHIENELIDYRCKHIEKLYSPVPNVSIIHLRHFCKEVKQIGKKYRVRKQFDSFLHQYLHVSKKIKRAQLPLVATSYQGIITGSDQVWNLSLSGKDLSYALDFVPDGVKRLSYAASYGPAQLPEDYKSLLIPCLQRMNWLSVREFSAIDQTKELTGRVPAMNVDPSALPEIEVWNRIAGTSRMSKKNFIFVYTMQPSDTLYKVAKLLAQENGLEILSLSMVYNKNKLGQDMTGIGVNDFLWLIRNAAYVVTNSFHGIMFSIRFHKRFFWSYQQGNHMSNPRFDMLSRLYHIEKRRCDAAEDYYNCPDMDFIEIEKILHEERKLAKADILKMVK